MLHLCFLVAMFIWVSRTPSPSPSSLMAYPRSGLHFATGNRAVVRCEELIYIHVLLQDTYTYVSMSTRKKAPQKRRMDFSPIRANGTTRRASGSEGVTLRYCSTWTTKQSLTFQDCAVCAMTMVLEDCDSGKGGEI